jgi:hypothetical protein
MDSAGNHKTPKFSIQSIGKKGHKKQKKKNCRKKSIPIHKRQSDSHMRQIINYHKKHK